MVSVQREIKVLADPEEVSRRAAEEFVRLADEATRAKGSFAVALSGGSTPKRLYALLGSAADSFRERVPWEKIHFFWGDERHVPPDHPESNYRMVREAMLSKVPLPRENVHRINAENPDAGEAAREYERALREFFRLRTGELPRFDLVLLGLGQDGHTASLFPGCDVIREWRRHVAASWNESFGAFRITLTPPVLNHAACVIFLVTGGEKAEALRAVLEGDHPPERLPARLIRPAGGRLLWLADREAARLLEPDGQMGLPR